MNIRSKMPPVMLFSLLLLSAGTAGIAGIGNHAKQVFDAISKADLLSAEDAIWIRPGLNLQIINVTIRADRKFTVHFRITDNNGQGLDRAGILTPGTVSTSFVLAYIPQNADQYVAHTVRTQTSPITNVAAVQASSDSGGSYVDYSQGVYVYTSGTTLPASYDPAATHTIGIYSARDLREWGLSRYIANELTSWAPNGGPVTKIRDVVPTAACNNCHDPLALHGGSRRKMELCILCHTPQTVDPDTGNTVDMPVMTHRIHRGRSLPSVAGGKPYVIIGNQQSVHDYSHVAFPMDIRNCQACHRDTAQVNLWNTRPTRANCGLSCHDDVNYATGAGHPGGIQADDRNCTRCHVPEGRNEWDAGIKTAHTVPYNSQQMRKPVLEFLGITNTGPGRSPTVRFRVTDKTGQIIPPATLAGTTGRLRFTLAGPNTDYRWYLQESADRATTDANGVSSYTFTGTLPVNASGSYTVEWEGRVAVALNPGPTQPTTYNDPIPSNTRSFAVTGTAAAPRRTAVDMAKCNKCHDKLMFHGNSRNTIESCVICHNPTLTAASGPAAAGRRESISFQHMIHKIHTGEELLLDYLIGTASFKEVLYPGDRRNCLACHSAGTYMVPLPAGTTPVSTPGNFWDPTRPTSAACLSCHDSVEAAVHAFVNTTAFAEACAVCHRESAAASVTAAHAR